MHGQAGVFGVHLEFGDLAVLKRGNPADTGNRQFVRAVRAMHQPCLLCPQLAQRFGHRADQIAGKGAGQLAFHTRRIGQRAKDVENRARAQFGAGGHDVGNGGVVHRGHHEGDANGFNGLFNHFRSNHHVDAHLPQRVRRAGFGRQVAVAVFGHGHTGARHHKGRGGGNVQRAFAIATGANDIHCIRRCLHRIAFVAHHLGGGGVFLHRFATGAQRHQQAADLAGGGISVKQDAECLFGLIAGQGAFGGGVDQGF